jgi:maleylpyruvate isomerase
VPALQTPDGVLTQSLAICEYLDEVHPQPALLPHDPMERARVRAFCQVIACDIHPIQNLKILNRLRASGWDDDAVTGWARQVIEEGFEACESLLAASTGPFCFGHAPGLADICLVPQVANAERFGVTMRWPRIAAIVAHCRELALCQGRSRLSARRRVTAWRDTVWRFWILSFRPVALSPEA